MDRVDELAAVVDAVLEQVGAARRAALEQLEDVGRLGVLAEHDHADLWMGLAKRRGHADALVALRGWHPDVRDHDVRPLRLDRGEEARLVGDRGDGLDARGLGEQPCHGLAHKEPVLGDHDPDRHVPKV